MAALILKIYSIFLITLNFGGGNGNETSSLVSHSRKVRGLLYGSWGITVALAFPLDLLNQEVFYSYNFEANFNVPEQAWEWIPGIWERFHFEHGMNRFTEEEEEAPTWYLRRSFSNCNSDSDSDSNSTCTESTESTSVAPTEHKEKRSTGMHVVTRQGFYQMLITKFQFAGFKGELCLLRMICEINQFSIGLHNGLLGSIFEIIFSPTSSIDESLPNIYYEAEQNGILGNCQKYKKKCRQSIFDLITQEFVL